MCVLKKFLHPGCRHLWWPSDASIAEMTRSMTNIVFLLLYHLSFVDTQHLLESRSDSLATGLIIIIINCEDDYDDLATGSTSTLNVVSHRSLDVKSSVTEVQQSLWPGERERAEANDYTPPPAQLNNLQRRWERSGQSRDAHQYVEWKVKKVRAV